MKIILITGMSGSGKTSLCKYLLDKYPDKYNFVFSYTDRKMRTKNEWGHTFVDSKYMDLLLERSDVVAKTEIEEKRYCTIKNQFTEDKINLYIVDTYGINDTIEAFPYADIMTVLIRRKDIEIECIRQERDVCVPVREDVDFLIDNNGKIDSAGNLLNTLVNFDFFKKPSHVATTINEKIDYIHEQHRFLNEIKESLYEQLWYNNESTYIRLCSFIESSLNNHDVTDGFSVKIEPDKHPEIYDGDLAFHVCIVYDDDNLGWNKLNRLTEMASFFANEYCESKGCNDILYNLIIFEKWAGEDATYD